MSRTNSPRSSAQWISPKQRMRFAAALRAAWTEEPLLTVAQVCAKTKAPEKVAQDVRRRLVAAGVVQPHLHVRRALLVDREKHDEARETDPLAEAGHA